MHRTIDAHQHFWRIARGDYGWLRPSLGILYRDFGPEDLATHLAASEIDATVLIQAAPTEAETLHLLDIAAVTPYVAGVVGWVDLAGSEAPDRLARLARNPLLRGIRPMLQDLPDSAWILRPCLEPALDAMIALGLRFDALVKPHHLVPLLRFIERHPDLPVVVDHGAKPDLRSGRLDEWSANMRTLARATSAYCKLSGLVTEANAEWRVQEVCDCIDHLVQCFGPDRLMWGSDWPVVEAAGGYRRWWDATHACLAGLPPDAREKILGRSAEAFYGLGAV